MASEAVKQPSQVPVLAISQTDSKVEITKDDENKTSAEADQNTPDNAMQTLRPLSDFKEDEFVSCPYNKAHQILISRMQTHLTKCRENFKNNRKRVCPYNESHMIIEMEWSLHCELCPDRTLGDGTQKTTEDPSQPSDSRSLVPIENRDAVMSTEENWDEEDSPTYDPNVKLEAVGTILVQPRGGKKYEREQFRAQRRRLYHQTVQSTKNLQTISECGTSDFDPDDKIGACPIPRYAKEGRMANSSSVARAANACKPNWESRKFVPQNDGTKHQEYFDDDCSSNYSNHRAATPSPNKKSVKWERSSSSRSSYADHDDRYNERKSSRDDKDQKYQERQDWGVRDDKPRGRSMYRDDYEKGQYTASKESQDRNFKDYRQRDSCRRDNHNKVDVEEEEYILNENGNWVVCSKNGHPTKNKQNYDQITEKPSQVFQEAENWGDDYTPVGRAANFYTGGSPPYSPSPMLVDTDDHRDYGQAHEYRYPESAEVPRKQNFNFETNSGQRNFCAEFRQKSVTPSSFKPIMTSPSRSTTLPIDKIKQEVGVFPWSNDSLGSVVLRPPSANLIAARMASPPEKYHQPSQTTSHTAFQYYNKQYGPEVYDEPVTKKQDPYETSYVNKRSDYYEVPRTMPAKKQEVNKKVELYVAPHLRDFDTSGRAHGGEKLAIPPGFEEFQQTTPRMSKASQYHAMECQPRAQHATYVFKPTEDLRPGGGSLFDSLEVSIGRGNRRKVY